VGGVEIHIKELANQLRQNGKIGNVIVITHKYNNDSDEVKYIGIHSDHGFRVYYLNIHYNKQYQITYPTFIYNFKTAVSILRG
jgi:glycosyltransferase involved in cell wall biosynthesis